MESRKGFLDDEGEDAVGDATGDAVLVAVGG
jgi:hypothetical protein